MITFLFMRDIQWMKDITAFFVVIHILSIISRALTISEATVSSAVPRR